MRSVSPFNLPPNSYECDSAAGFLLPVPRVGGAGLVIVALLARFSLIGSLLLGGSGLSRGGVGQWSTVLATISATPIVGRGEESHVRGVWCHIHLLKMIFHRYF